MIFALREADVRSDMSAVSTSQASSSCRLGKEAEVSYGTMAGWSKEE